MLNIVWFKRDLRVDNHAALSNGLNNGPTIALYCWESTIWMADDASLSQQSFIGECLRHLRQSLADIGVSLHISSLGIVETLTFIEQDQTIAKIHSHEETSNLNSYSIDKAVAGWCKANNVKWHEYAQNGVTRRLKNRDKWHGMWEEHMRSPLIKLSRSSINHPEIKLPRPDVTRARGEDKPERQSGGREQALTILNSFLTHRSTRYRGGISSPIKASEASSRLSPYLAWGCLSMREVVQANRSKIAHNRADGLGTKHPLILGLKSFESRLHWHFMQKLESEPTLEVQHMHAAHADIRDESLSDIESQRRLNA